MSLIPHNPADSHALHFLGLVDNKGKIGALFSVMDGLGFTTLVIKTRQDLQREELIEKEGLRPVRGAARKQAEAALLAAPDDMAQSADYLVEGGKIFFASSMGRIPVGTYYRSSNTYLADGRLTQVPARTVKGSRHRHYPSYLKLVHDG